MYPLKPGPVFGNQFGNHKNVECGLCCIIRRPNTAVDENLPVPLISVSTVASVVHSVAQVEITQVYVNKEEQPIEAIYYFPVDSNGAVTHFHAELEGRTIKGVVKAQEEAKAQYEKAIEQKQTAFLGEENKPDIFKVRIGFLKPGAQVKIVIGYVTEVKNEKGSNSIRFFLPTTVAPRYIPPTETDPKGKDLINMRFSQHSPAPLTIKVTVAIQGDIDKVESPTHEIVVTEKGIIPEKTNWNRAVVELNGKTTDMDRDFVLLVTPAESHKPRLYTEKLADGNSVAAMAHFIPSFKLDEQNAELIFLLDRSGSMMGSSIEVAKKALLLFLHSAPADCYFNIIGFGGTYKFLFPESVKYDDITLKTAVEHARTLTADMGGTEILEPLKEIYSRPQIPGYLRQIFVLTDGEVSNTEQVIGLTKVHAHTTRVFSLGIGDAASHHLVEGIATAGGGTAALATYKESIDTKVLQQLKNAIQPSLTDVTVTWEGVTASSPAAVVLNTEKTLLGYGKPMEVEAPATQTFKQAPRKVPPIFDGSQLLLLGVFCKEVPTGISITAVTPDGPLSLNIPINDGNEVGSTGMLHKLAGIKIVRELELDISALGFSSSETKSQEEAIKKEIIEIATEIGIGSKYTSFIAVDSDSKSMDENWVMQTRYVPTQYAHGWHGGRGPMMMACSMPAAPPGGNFSLGRSCSSFGSGYVAPTTSLFGATSMTPQSSQFCATGTGQLFGAAGAVSSPSSFSFGNLNSTAFGCNDRGTKNSNAALAFGGFGSAGNSKFSTPFGLQSGNGGNSVFQSSTTSFGFVPATSSNSNDVGTDTALKTNSSSTPQQFSYNFGGSMASSSSKCVGLGASMNWGTSSSKQAAAQTRLQQTQAKVDEVANIMRTNVAMVLEKDARLSELSCRADLLSHESGFFGKLKMCKSLSSKKTEKSPSPVQQQLCSESLGAEEMDEGAEKPKEMDPLHAVVSLQSFSGSFSLNAEFCVAISIDFAELKEEAAKNNWDETAFATALAMEFFVQKLADRKESWELVYNKAKKWLSKNHSSIVDAVLAAAQDKMKN